MEWKEQLESMELQEEALDALAMKVLEFDKEVETRLAGYIRSQPGLMALLKN